MDATDGRKSSKNFWFLKIPDDYFYSKEMKKLRRIAGGAVYSLIYLKMQQIAMKSSGRIYFDGLEDTVAAEIALTIDESPEDVQATLVLLEKMGLAERESAETIYLPESEENTGRETEWARKKRDYRAKLAAANQSRIGQSEDNVLNMSSMCPTDIDIDTDIDTDTERVRARARVRLFGPYENVKLTDEELEKLEKDFPNTWREMVNNLSTYMQTHGADYADHNAIMRKWAAEDAKKAKRGSGGSSNAFSSYEGQREYTSEEYDELELRMRQRRTGDPEKGAADD